MRVRPTLLMQLNHIIIFPVAYKTQAPMMIDVIGTQFMTTRFLCCSAAFSHEGFLDATSTGPTSTNLEVDRIQDFRPIACRHRACRRRDQIPHAAVVCFQQTKTILVGYGM